MKIIRKKSCRRHLVVFCMLIITVHLGNAQKTNFPISSILTRFNTGKNSIENRLKSCFLYPNLYYYTSEDWNEEKRMMKFYSFNTTNQHLDSFTVKIPAEIVFMNLPAFSINSNFLIFIDESRFDMYHFTKKENTYVYEKIIKKNVECAAQDITPLEQNKFLISSFYNWHPDDPWEKSNLFIYDAEKRAITKIAHPQMACLELKVFKTNLVTVSSDRIYLADPCGYKIKCYNFELEQVNEINYNPPGSWTNLPGNKIPGETDVSKIHVKLLIDKLLLMRDTIAMIENIFSINKNMLLVSSSISSNRNIKRIDLWDKQSTKKPIFTNESVNVSWEGSHYIDTNSLPFFLKDPISYYIKDNFLYTVDETDFYPPKNSTLQEFNFNKDKYYEKNDPTYTISTFKIQFP